MLLHDLTGTELHSPYLPKKTPVLKFINGKLISVPVFHRNFANDSHARISM